MKYLFKLIRPINCFLASFSVLIVMITLYGIEFDIWPDIRLTVAGMSVVFFFTAGGNVLNDYVDKDVDMINHPERPIPSGKIEPKTALYMSVGLFSLSILSSFFLPFYHPHMILAIALICMISYEILLKQEGLIGNLTISLLTGMVFVFGGSVYGELFLPTVLGILAFLSTLGREIIKDIQDITGDLDRKTLPMKIGISRSKKIISLSISLAVAFSPLPYILSIFSIWYLLVVVFADIIFIYSITLLSKPKKAQSYVKMAMGVALLAFLIGGIL